LLIYPLYDMARVFTRRISKGKHPMSADKSHVHHFLLRSGLKHNQVALLLGLIQVVLIGLVLGMGNYSDNIVLPLLSAIVLLMGSRLDKITVKSLKKRIHREPRVLDLRPLKTTQRVKIKVEDQMVNSAKMNLN
ncbi:MAG: undecaprenyl/decaprenyl-phosphate alpha-N-acetylglucosaminyl 1-phosphate transferase, partial [Algoriphagus aquaeductus]